jgi:hypothetical protein
MEVMTPDSRLIPCSAPGEYGRSMDTLEEFLVCREVLELTEPDWSTSPAPYLLSSAAFLLSFLVLLEKKDLPPEDCLDLLSAADMIVCGGNGRIDHRCAPCGYSQVGCA